MKNNSGITLTSLVVYVIVMIMVLGIISSITSIFYTNVNGINGSSIEIYKFNNFNNYFVKEIKLPNNAIDKISNDGSYILFKSGNSFSFNNNNIYYNNLIIVKGVKSVSFGYYNYPENNDIISVSVQFEKFSKQINYKVEEIY